MVKSLRITISYWAIWKNALLMLSYEKKLYHVMIFRRQNSNSISNFNFLFIGLLFKKKKRNLNQRSTIPILSWAHWRRAAAKKISSSMIKPKLDTSRDSNCLCFLRVSIIQSMITNQLKMLYIKWILK